MDLLIPHTQAVRKGAPNVFLIGDMPYMTYQVSPQEAVRNAGRLFKETGIDAVKLEGGAEIAEKVKATVAAGIPVIGHIGLLPQRISLIGRYRVQGKDASSARVILEDALALQEAGVFAIVLESVTAEAAKHITEKLRVPTLGAGSGPYVDGQSLNLYDIIGLSLGVVPRFAKKYLNLAEDLTRVLGEFKGDVDAGRFPAEENFFRMEEKEVMKLSKAKKKSRS